MKTQALNFWCVQMEIICLQDRNLLTFGILGFTLARKTNTQRHNFADWDRSSCPKALSSFCDINLCFSKSLQKGFVPDCPVCLGVWIPNHWVTLNYVHILSLIEFFKCCIKNWEDRSHSEEILSKTSPSLVLNSCWYMKLALSEEAKMFVGQFTKR